MNYPMNMLTDEQMKEFVASFSDFENLFKQIAEIKIKGVNFELKNKKSAERNKRMETIYFAYREIFDFPGDDREISAFVTKNFVTSVFDLLFCETNIHHSYVSGEILGYAHDFCNRKVKEIYHRQFSFS